MSSLQHKFRRIVKGAALGVAVMAIGCAFGADPVFAQVSGSASDLFGSENAAGPDAQMLLEADQLIYNQDEDTVAAVGNVRVAYNGYNLVARQVTYSRRSGRVLATGDVEILEPNGSRIFAEEIDITDDFQNGFVTALKVESADNTRFAAESAERRDGDISVFSNGVYTACLPCRGEDKPPLWQIRAKTVTLNNTEKTVEYNDATFEFYGAPIAYLPYFKHADPSVKRKSGFLSPIPTYAEDKGIGVRSGYFWALAPHYDVTLWGTYYSNQGFLGEAEWRHRLENGQYNLRIAGIDQMNPDDFRSKTIDAAETSRYSIMSSGKFDLSDNWVFGWSALHQSDENFARTYGLNEFNTRDVTNKIYLTGLAGKNYFDLRAERYLIQDSFVDQVNLFDLVGGNQSPGVNDKLEDEQALVLPSMDWNRVSNESIWGGELSFDMNMRSVHRSRAQLFNFSDDLDPSRFGVSVLPGSERYHGVAGTNSRLTAQSEWKRSDIFNGAVFTASFSGRADGIFQDNDPTAFTTLKPLPTDDTLFRGMAAGMLEIRYPVVAQDGFATHLFEPIAQVIVRPNETHIGQFPNEDAQSLVFDHTSLFDRDKFSGYDRVEGGTRANVGFRYSANFLNGANLNIIGGQSFHLAGLNSFANGDLVNTGLESGLETTRSDYVLGATLDSSAGMSIGLSGRFDEKDLGLRRGDASLRYLSTWYSFGTTYSFIDAQPLYAFSDERHEVAASGSVSLTDEWRLFGSFTYDLENDTAYQRTLGLAYDACSCFSFSVAYNTQENRYTGDQTQRSLMFRLGLRTIGDVGYKYTLDDTN